MRAFWIRIGIGATAVFVSGLFVVSLARQARTAVAEALHSGGEVRLPPAVLPLRIHGHQAGFVRQIRVDRSGPGELPELRLAVSLRGDPIDIPADCGLRISEPGPGTPLFDCVALQDQDAREWLRIGEVRFEPGGVVRPIVVDRIEAADWFGDLDRLDLAEFRMLADAPGGTLEMTGRDGNARFLLSADSSGVRIQARDQTGQVVRLQAGSTGVDLKVARQP